MKSHEEIRAKKEQKKRARRASKGCEESPLKSQATERGRRRSASEPQPTQTSRRGYGDTEMPLRPK
jgi:hypothetical protein